MGEAEFGSRAVLSEEDATDGRAAEVKPSVILDRNARILWGSAGDSGVIWTVDSAEDPN